MNFKICILLYIGMQNDFGQNDFGKKSSKRVIIKIKMAAVLSFKAENAQLTVEYFTREM